MTLPRRLRATWFFWLSAFTILLEVARDLGFVKQARDVIGFVEGGISRENKVWNKPKFYPAGHFAAQNRLCALQRGQNGL